MRRARTHSPTSDSSMEGPIPHYIISEIKAQNASWEQRTQALQYITNSCLQNQDESTQNLFVQQLRSIASFFAICINCLRSTLVKEACHCIQSLAKQLGPPFVDAVGDEIIPALLKATAVKKAVIRDGSLAAMKAIFKHGVQGVSLDMVRMLAQNVIDKKIATDIRHTASQCIGMILVQSCISGLQYVYQVVQDAILYGCIDPDEAVRAQSRINCLRLEALDPTYGKATIEKLEQNVRQLIDKEREDFEMDQSLNFGIRTSPSQMKAQRSNLPQRVNHSQSTTDASTNADKMTQPKEVSPLSNRTSMFSSMPRPAARNPLPQVEVLENVDALAISHPSLPPRPSRRVTIAERNDKTVSNAAAARKPPRPSMRPPRRSIHPGSTVHSAIITEKTSVKPPTINNTPQTQLDEKNIASTTDKKFSIPSSASTASPNSVHSGSPSSSSSETTVSTGSPHQPQLDEQTTVESPPHTPNESNSVSSIEKKSTKDDTDSDNVEISAQVNPENSEQTAITSESHTSSSPSYIKEEHATPLISIGNEKSNQSHESKGSQLQNVIDQLPTHCDDGCDETKTNDGSILSTCDEDVRKGRLSFILGTNITPVTNHQTNLITNAVGINKPMTAVKRVEIRLPTIAENTDVDQGSKSDNESCEDEVDEVKLSTEGDIKQQCKSASESTLIANEENTVASEECRQVEDCNEEQLKIPKNQQTDKKDNSSQPLETQANSAVDAVRKSTTIVTDAPKLTASKAVASTQNKPNHKATTKNKPPLPPEKENKRPKNPFSFNTNDQKKERIFSKPPAGSTARGIKTTSVISKPKKSTLLSRRLPRRSVMPLSNANDPNGMSVTTTQVSSNNVSANRLPRVSTVPTKINRTLVAELAKSQTSTSGSIALQRVTNTIRSKPSVQTTIPSTNAHPPTIPGIRRVNSARINRPGIPNRPGISDQSAPVQHTRTRSSSVAEIFGKTRLNTNILSSEIDGETKPIIRRPLPENVQLVITCLRAAMAAKSSNWAKKDATLSSFTDSLRRLKEEKLSGRLAEDCVSMLGDFIHETHHKVLLGALDGFFFLFLCTEGKISSAAMQKVLERRPDILRRVLHLMKDGHEDVRLGCARVMQGFEVQFGPETQVGILIRAMTTEARSGSSSRRTLIPDGRVAEKGCSHLLSAFERADTSGDGFVWRSGTLRSLVEMLSVLSKDRRVEVRHASTKVVTAVKNSLPEGAFPIACKKAGVVL